jgi:hypothetical protein
VNQDELDESLCAITILIVNIPRLNERILDAFGCYSFTRRRHKINKFLTSWIFVIFLLSGILVSLSLSPLMVLCTAVLLGGYIYTHT